MHHDQQLQCQDLTGISQVSRSIKASHAPWSADKQGQELIGLCQVSRSSKANHAPWSAATQGQELKGLCQVSRSIKGSHAPCSEATQGQELTGLCQVSRSIKASLAPCSAATQGQELTGLCHVSRSFKASHAGTMISSYTWFGSNQGYVRSADPLKQVMQHAQQLNQPIIFRFANDAVFLTLYTKGTFSPIPKWVNTQGSTHFRVWQKDDFCFCAVSESIGQALYILPSHLAAKCLWANDKK